MTEITRAAPREPLPQGTVTLLFTDIQGSTRLLQRLGGDYALVLSAHNELLREAFFASGGREVATEGDAFFVAFARAKDAVAAALAAQQALWAHDWRHGRPVLVRMGIHTGEPVVIDDDYIGIDVHRASRICSAAHGGQVVISDVTRKLLDPAPVQGVDFKDLGVYRLKDLERAEHVWQLVSEGLPAEFPPLRSARPPTNIPRNLDSMVGRREEKRWLRRALREAETRLVTVTGPGGTGKTRLSVAVALEALDDFMGGAFFVDLSAVHTKALVAARIAEALEVSLDGDRPVTEAVCARIGDNDMLLLCDNFEQALDGAPVVSALLEACPRLKLLVTSRVLLSIRGERQYRLSPLPLPEEPSLDGVAASEAAQLFVARAALARPGFELTDANAGAVAEICRVLDGLPLALELAAARIKLLSPEGILGRLDHRLKLLTGGPRDYPLRHRALRTTIDWSYDLLSTEERELFQCLSVFNGGSTLEAIEAVAGGNDGHGDVLDALTSLVDHSLVRQREEHGGETRFGMLQTIREYGVELLDSRPERVEVRDRHARYYLKMAERLGAEVAERSDTAGTLEIEHGNLLTALEWWEQRAGQDSRGYGPFLLRLASSLGRCWYRHGLVLEGAVWLERALAVTADAEEELRANTLRLLGIMMEMQGRPQRAKELFEQALVSFRERGDRAGEAACLNSLGIVARLRGELATAQELIETSASIRREIGDEAGVSASLGNLGIVYLDRGSPERAQQMLEESIALDRKLGDEWGIACSTNNLGVVSLEWGDGQRASKLATQAMQIFTDLDAPDGAVECMEALAGVAAGEGRAIRAARLAGASDSLRHSLGVPLAPVDATRLDRWLERAKSELGDAAFNKAWSEGAKMTSGQGIAYAFEPISAS